MTTKIHEFDKDPGLDKLQEAVGGDIQVIPGFVMYKGRKCVLVADEDGKMRQKDINHKITSDWHDQFGNPADVIVGDVAVVYGGLR